jgi:hypothetical protein
MVILAILAFITLVISVFFIAVVLGLRQVHPTDLALQRSTRLAALASGVVGLHVRRGEPMQTKSAAECDRAVR